jgi:hypothetical protein
MKIASNLVFALQSRALFIKKERKEKKIPKNLKEKKSEHIPSIIST